MTALLSCQDLTFGYPGGETLINNLSWELAGGQMVAITGESGRGKSTLLYLLGLMLTPASGQIRIHGHNTAKLRDADRSEMRAKYLGFVFQDAALDATRTVIDNVTEVALYQGMERNLAKVVGYQLLQELGVDIPPDRKPGQVSGGQAQRIALARALVTAPQIIFADEPTGNLDDANAEVVITRLERVAQAGGLVLVATHDPRLEARCDHVRQL